jgi:hypothetical protein
VVSSAAGVVAGTGRRGHGDGPGPLARFDNPRGLALSSCGRFVLVADSGNHCIRRLDLATGVVTTVCGRVHAGAGVAGHIDGPAGSALLSSPVSICLCADGSYAIADSGNHSVRRLSGDLSSISTLAGTGFAGHADGSRSQASFSSPVCVLPHPSGLLVVDRGSSLIRMIDTHAGHARVRTIEAPGLFKPEAAWVVGGGLVLVADTGNRVLKALHFGRQPLAAATPPSSEHRSKKKRSLSSPSPGKLARTFSASSAASSSLWSAAPRRPPPRQPPMVFSLESSPPLGTDRGRTPPPPRASVPPFSPFTAPSSSSSSQALRPEHGGFLEVFVTPRVSRRAQSAPPSKTKSSSTKAKSAPPSSSSSKTKKVTLAAEPASARVSPSTRKATTTTLRVTTTTVSDPSGSTEDNDDDSSSSSSSSSNNDNNNPRALLYERDERGTWTPVSEVKLCVTAEGVVATLPKPLKPLLVPLEALTSLVPSHHESQPPLLASRSIGFQVATAAELKELTRSIRGQLAHRLQGELQTSQKHQEEKESQPPVKVSAATSPRPDPEPESVPAPAPTPTPAPASAPVPVPVPAPEQPEPEEHHDPSALSSSSLNLSSKDKSEVSFAMTQPSKTPHRPSLTASSPLAVMEIHPAPEDWIGDDEEERLAIRAEPSSSTPSSASPHAHERSSHQRLSQGDPRAPGSSPTPEALQQQRLLHAREAEVAKREAELAAERVRFEREMTERERASKAMESARVTLLAMRSPPSLSSQSSSRPFTAAETVSPHFLLDKLKHCRRTIAELTAENKALRAKLNLKPREEPDATEDAELEGILSSPQSPERQPAPPARAGVAPQAPGGGAADVKVKQVLDSMAVLVRELEQGLVAASGATLSARNPGPLLASRGSQDDLLVFRGVAYRVHSHLTAEGERSFSLKRAVAAPASATAGAIAAQCLDPRLSVLAHPFFDVGAGAEAGLAGVGATAPRLTPAVFRGVLGRVLASGLARRTSAQLQRQGSGMWDELASSCMRSHAERMIAMDPMSLNPSLGSLPEYYAEALAGLDGGGLVEATVLDTAGVGAFCVDGAFLVVADQDFVLGLTLFPGSSAGVRPADVRKVTLSNRSDTSPGQEPVEIEGYGLHQPQLGDCISAQFDMCAPQSFAPAPRGGDPADAVAWLAACSSYAFSVTLTMELTSGARRETGPITLRLKLADSQSSLDNRFASIKRLAGSQGAHLPRVLTATACFSTRSVCEIVS